jgi:hypothetical protein
MEKVFQSLCIDLSSFGDSSPVPMVRLCIVVLKEGFQEREERKATPRADFEKFAGLKLKNKRGFPCHNVRIGAFC